MTDTAQPKSIYVPHNPALITVYGDLENFARGLDKIFTGTPGSVVERTNAGGFKFFAHQYYDAAGKKTDRYIAGPVGDSAAENEAAKLRLRIAEANQALPNLRLLAREGFKLLDSKAYATLASLHNAGFFDAGAMLVGSHAYGALLNQLGARAAQYTTQDVDIARAAELAFEEVPQKSFLETLRDSGIQFFEVPRLNNKSPGTSFKEPGKSYFQVDLLVPSDNEAVRTIPVPEIKAHATALPYLGYLLAQSQESLVLAREGCCRVRVPLPERFALHKMVVSQLRKSRGEKSRNDLSQAAVLFAILTQRHPGAIESAATDLPVSARKHVKAAASVTREELKPHPRAIEVLDELLEFQGSNEE